jgi:hypothetical protein
MEEFCFNFRHRQQLYHLNSVQLGYGTKSFPYSTGTGRSLPGNKAAEKRILILIQSTAEVKNDVPKYFFTAQLIRSEEY